MLVTFAVGVSTDCLLFFSCFIQPPAKKIKLEVGKGSNDESGNKEEGKIEGDRKKGEGADIIRERGSEDTEGGRKGKEDDQGAQDIEDGTKGKEDDPGAQDMEDGRKGKEDDQGAEDLEDGRKGKEDDKGAEDTSRGGDKRDKGEKNSRRAMRGKGKEDDESDDEVVTSRRHKKAGGLQLCVCTFHYFYFR